MATMINIQHADILQRPVGKDQFGFVGVIFGDNLDALKEGPGYVMGFNGNNLAIDDSEVLPIPDYYDQSDIGGILTSESWLATSMAGYSTARVMPMGGGQNGLIVYGANKLPLIEPLPGKEDTLLLFSNGQMITKKADPSVTLGNALHQTLQMSGLFTNPEGQRLYLPVLSSPARAIMLEIRDMEIKLARSEITKEEFQDWRHENEDRRSLSIISDSHEDYHRYLDILDKLSAKAGISTDLTQCMTGDEHKKFETISRKAFEKSQEMKYDPYI